MCAPGLTAYGRQLSAILAKGKGRWNPGWLPTESGSGQFNIDCLGQTEGGTRAFCDGEVEKIDTPCAACISAHQEQQGHHDCYVYICVVQAPEVSAHARYTKIRISFSSRRRSRISAALSKSRFFAASFISFVSRLMALSRSSSAPRSSFRIPTGPAISR